MASIDRENPQFMLEIQRRDELDTQRAAAFKLARDNATLPHHWARHMHEGEPETMRGRLATLGAVRTYIEAGNATLTVQSKVTGTRFTFKFVRPPEKPGDARPIWVRLLSGPDNESDYTFLGTIWNGVYKHSSKSRVSDYLPSVQAVQRCNGYCAPATRHLNSAKCGTKDGAGGAGAS